MATAWRSKWLDWKPEDQNIQGSLENELTTLTKEGSVSFVSATPARSQIISRPADEPGAWLDSFNAWVAMACVFRDRCFAGISSLHIHFCEWAMTHDDPCTRPTFETLLTDAGFLYADGMVYGLILKEDAAWQEFLRTERRKA